jgi:hypothetical protein
MVPISRRRSGPTERRVARDERGKEMTEMALRSRMAVLIVAALLSLSGAFGTSAFLTAEDAQAGIILTGPCPKNACG